MASGYAKLGTQEAANDMFVTENRNWKYWNNEETSLTLTARNCGGVKGCLIKITSKLLAAQQ